ncbi:ATP-binding protein [Streptomyces europaeiscabiei]|uniref:ATP-binding protein n=1 Tax=Streptomyces europaeiscabiei TaxID=146819 RepID=UPI002E1180B3|nr:ATP-binding protein [Streptomyces europaeiscabiei]
MHNPFTIPDRGGSDGRPLCPWETSEHEHFYAPVDHTQQAFSEFDNHFSQNHDFSKVGRVVLITGPGGSGKTSLLHRCAWTAQRFLASQPQPQPVVVIDLTSDGLIGSDTSARSRHICSRLHDELKFHRLFDKPDSDELEKKAEDPPKFYPYLSRLLKDKDRVLIILLPPSEVADEVHSYNSYSHGMIVFYCESSYAEVCGIDTAPAGMKPIFHVELGVLEEADGWTFVQHRLDRARATGKSFPDIEEGVIREFMQARIRGRGKTTVRELQMTCENVFEAAVSSSLTRVTYANFTQYYTERGSLS